MQPGSSFHFFFVDLYAKDYLLAFQTANARGPSIGGRVVSEVRWTPPYSGNLAPNFAGFVLPDDQGASAGVVIRDEYGECIDWKVAFWPHILERDHAEALAARFAVEMAGNYQDVAEGLLPQCVLEALEIDRLGMEGFSMVLKEMVLCLVSGFPVLRWMIRV
ncbi:hypothetical protein Salat_2796600 [Sesamum alatum]|uniref:Uncharacterized protein n=1 Tax=Sesamum alatum TaxID=300844 RepID=A0AAE2C9D2_9LAMI|nr:hypothetical protein Salat_2796600 [Sesamum alatum]